MTLVAGSISAAKEHCSVRIDRAQALAFAEATNDGNPIYRASDLVPPVFGVVPTWDATTRVFTQVIPSESMPMLLHLEHDMRFHRPLVRDLEMESEVFAYSTRTSSFGTRITVRTTGRNGGGIALDQYGTVFVRGLTGGLNEGPDKPDHTFPREARERLVTTVSMPIDANQPHRYSQASGDSNRIHIDDEFARSVGLPGIILHGLCTLAMCSSALVDTLADRDPAQLRRLAARFSKPVFPGDNLEVSIYEAGPVQGTADVAFAYEATSGGERVIRDGRAELGPPPGKTRT